MGVQVGKTTVEMAKVEEPAKVALELKLFERYTRKGNLYVKGQAYLFDEETAKTVLKLEDHGRPIFVRYKPRANERVIEVGPVMVDMTGKAPANSFAEVRAGAPTKLEIGDESELKAEGIDLGEEEGGTEGVVEV